MAAREDELVRRDLRLGELAAIRSEGYAAAVQRLRGGDGGTCRLRGNTPRIQAGVCVRITPRTFGCDSKVLKRSAGGVATRRARPIRFIVDPRPLAYRCGDEIL